MVEAAHHIYKAKVVAIEVLAHSGAPWAIVNPERSFLW